MRRRDEVEVCVDPACEVSNALDASAAYGLSANDAARIVGEVRGAVSRWRRVATSLGISKSEQEAMSAAFSDHGRRRC